MCLCDLEIQPQEDFGKKLVNHLNSASTVLLLSVGHRTRLFDVLDDLGPSTSRKIAEAAGLQERYVREWLGGMVVAGVIDYRASFQSYELRAEAANYLTRRASPNNLAATAQYIPLLASVEDSIVECFTRGGGVPYEAYGRFHQVMAEESSQTVVSALQSDILELVPGLKQRLTRGIQVLDVGCGSGKALLELARNYPASRFFGYDFSTEAIEIACREARHLENIFFEVRDVSRLETGIFELVLAFDAIHDQAHPDRVLAQIHQSLSPTGVFLMQDIRTSSYLENNLDHPFGPFLYAISCLHCMTVSLAQGGMGLGATWGQEKALEMLREAGFQKVQVNRLAHDPQNNFYVCEP